MFRWAKKLAALGALIALLSTLPFSTDVFISDWAHFRAEKALAEFKSAGDQRNIHQLDAARRAIDRALALLPNNPKYLSLSAQILVWEGYFMARQANSSKIEVEYYRKAITLLRRALEFNPSHARTWALLVEYKIRIGQRDEEWHLAREKTLELGGSDRKLVERVLK